MKLPKKAFQHPAITYRNPFSTTIANIVPKKSHNTQVSKVTDKEKKRLYHFYKRDKRRKERLTVSLTKKTKQHIAYYFDIKNLIINASYRDNLYLFYTKKVS